MRVSNTSYEEIPTYLLLLEKLIGSHSINPRDFMELEGSLPRLKLPATCLYPERDQSSPWTPWYFLKFRLNILPFTSGSSKWPLSLSPPPPPPKALYVHLLSPKRVMCPAHLILLDLITRLIFGEEFSTLSSLLCSFQHSPVTSLSYAQIYSKRNTAIKFLFILLWNY